MIEYDPGRHDSVDRLPRDSWTRGGAEVMPVHTDVSYVRGLSFKLVATIAGTYDPPSIAAGGANQTTITVDGVSPGDIAFAAHDKATSANIGGVGGNYDILAIVSAPNVVTVNFYNHTVAAVDLPSGTLRVSVIRFS